MARPVLLHASQPYPAHPRDLSIQSVRFPATDGVRLSGWLVRAQGARASVILVPGFDDDRAGMIPYARMLHAAGFNVLLYDNRGTGASGGRFSFGAREVEDVRGADAYLRRHHSALIRNGSAILGVSLGAGVAIVAASELPSVRAVVADSPYVNQNRLFDGFNHLSLHGRPIPLAPISQWVAERLTDASFASFSPLQAAHRLRSRALLLIHSRHDRNPTTPYADTLALHHADPAAHLWVAPHGGHAEALAAQPAAYRSHVVPFLRANLPG